MTKVLDANRLMTHYGIMDYYGLWTMDATCDVCLRVFRVSLALLLALRMLPLKQYLMFAYLRSQPEQLWAAGPGSVVSRECSVCSVFSFRFGVWPRQCSAPLSIIAGMSDTYLRSCSQVNQVYIRSILNKGIQHPIIATLRFEFES